jgi:hypothetical protein
VRVSKIVEISFDNVLEIVKRKRSWIVGRFLDVFKAERNFSVCKSTPRKNKCRLMLILGFDMNLIVS